MDSKKKLLKRDSSPSSDTSDSRQSQVHRNMSQVDQPRVTVLQEISHNNASDLGHTYYKESLSHIEKQKKYNSCLQPKSNPYRINMRKNYRSKRQNRKKVEVSRPGTKTATSHDSTQATVITAVLQDLRDDVVTPRAIGPPVIYDEHKHDRSISGRDNVYVQNRSGFALTPRERALTLRLGKNGNSNHEWMNEIPDSSRETPLDVAIQVQSIVTPIAGICFGLLGGIALMQLILAFSLSAGMDGSEGIVFLESYSKIASIAPIAFYILLAFCVVSVLDRFDFAHLDMNHCIDILTYRQSWAVAIIYILVLVSTLSCAYYDDMFILYPNDKTFTHNKYQLSQSLYEWQLWNTCRTILAVVGWIVFSLTVPDDLLLHHLKSIKQYEKPDKPVFIVQPTNTPVY